MKYVNFTNNCVTLLLQHNLPFQKKNNKLFEAIYQIHGEHALQNGSERRAEETRTALHHC